MTKLSDCIDEIKGQLEVFVDTKDSHKTTKEYDYFIEKLEKIPQALEGEFNNIHIISILSEESALRKLGIDEVRCLNSTKASLSAFKDHWIEKDVAARQEGVLDDYITIQTGFIKTLKQKNKEEWFAELENLKHQFVVDEHLIESQLHLDSEAIKRAVLFKERRFTFDTSTTKIPQSIDDVQAIVVLVDELKGIANEINQNQLPPMIHNFMRTASTREGAKLLMFTEEVKDYLEEHKIQHEFVICRKRVSR
jgi:hypothetical protein